MKTANMICVTLMFFLASCGPAAAPAGTPTTPAQATPTPSVQPISWPGLHNGWMTFTNHNVAYAGSFTYDPAGYLWAINANEVFRWDLKSGDLVLYTPLDGLPKNITSLTLFQGKPWVLASGGKVATFSDGKWTSQTIAPDNGSFYMLSSTGDRLWASGKEIYYFDGQAWKSFDQMPQKPQYYCGPISVLKSQDGSLWFSGCGEVMRFDGHNWQSYDNLQGTSQMFTLTDGTLIFVLDEMILSFDGSHLKPLVLPGDYYEYPIQSHLMTPDGDLWFQTRSAYSGDAGSAYLLHDGQIQQAPALDLKDAPDQNLYTPIAMIPGGWVFNEGDTLYLFDGKIWKTIASTEQQSFGAVINDRAIGFAPEGSLWILQEGWPAKYDGKEIETPFKTKPPQDQPYECTYRDNYVIDSKGSIWGASWTSPTLCYYDPTTKQVMRFTLFFNVSQLAAGPDGGIWVASDAGFLAHLTLSELESGDYRQIQLIKIGGDTVQFALSPDRIQVGADGAVWVLMKNAGLYRYDGNDWKYLGLSNLQDQSAFAIDAKGHVWAGYCNGLQEYDGEKWVQFPHNCINPTQLAIAPDGAVWFISGSDGVYRFDGNQWTQFTLDQTGGYTPQQILVAPDGALWFVGYQAWARYKP